MSTNQTFSFEGNPDAVMKGVQPVSYFKGFAGALLGGLVGAIPWFAAVAFLQIFSAWLGAVIGLGALFGYKLFGGAKKFGYAMTAIVVSALIMVVLSDFAANMVILCSDETWKADAAFLGISVQELAFTSLIDPINLSIILKDLAIGGIFALLGVALMHQQVRNYVESDIRPVAPAAQPTQEPQEQAEKEETL